MFKYILVSTTQQPQLKKQKINQKKENPKEKNLPYIPYGLGRGPKSMTSNKESERGERRPSRPVQDVRHGVMRSGCNQTTQNI
jgi:hypothetical protein